TPVLHPPDGIPADRIHISGWMTSRDCDVTDCRHGRLLAIDCKWLFLFSPITGEERNLPVPRQFRKCNYHNGAVICAASGQDHVHGFCHNSPFKVALLSIHRIIKTEQGTVGWVRFSFPNLEIWLRKKNCHGIATWLQHKTVDMHGILGIPPRVSKKRWHEKILAYDEENNVIILYVQDSAYMLDLKSMQSTKLDESRLMKSCHPFTSFYPPDMAI
ncbi:hypothetical protein CFC21_038977, partial [Triticum aestivum]